MFGDEADCGRCLYINADLASLIDWAGLEALLSAFLWLAFVWIDDCNSLLVLRLIVADVCLH